MGSWRCAFGDWANFSPLQRVTPEAATLYSLTHLHDDIEPIVENLRREEIGRSHQFLGCYAWNLGGDRSLLLVSRCTLVKPLDRIEVRASHDLRNEPGLTKVMHVVPIGPSRFGLSLRPDTAFHLHPFLGEYLLVWLSSSIKGIRSPSGEAVVFP